MDGTLESLGVYVSVPFCRAKCSFCNFASGVSSAEAIEGYLGALCREIAAAQHVAARHGATLPASVDTVYFGGGTPSLLEPVQLARIFTALREVFVISPDAEITLEAAPGQISDSVLETAMRSGVNRISLGVQSFVDRESQAVGRSHTEAGCRAEFKRLRAHGVCNVGADLIAGLPLQTEASWEHSLTVAFDCGLTHLSVYMLEVDDESRLGREVLGGGARLHAPAVPTEELVADLYERACAALPANGFAQYEISNFATAGAQSRHNLKYWRRAPYVGFGLDAHSMLRDVDGRAVRWANTHELSSYAGEGTPRSPEWISEHHAFEETVFLELRLVEGLAFAKLEGFPQAWRNDLGTAADVLVRAGLMGRDNERLWLTPRGRLVSGEIFGELLAGAPA